MTITQIAGATIAMLVPWAAVALVWMRLRDAETRLAALSPPDDGRIRTIIDVVPLPSTGPDFESDARYDLFVNGERAGYGMRPAQVKTEVVEGLDIEMRGMSGFDPPSR
jgi:hypothetical protein